MFFVYRWHTDIGVPIVFVYRYTDSRRLERYILYIIFGGKICFRWQGGLWGRQGSLWLACRGLSDKGVVDYSRIRLAGRSAAAREARGVTAL